MSYGLRVFNAAGVLSLDVSDSLCRYIGTFGTGNSDGSVNFPGLSTGRPWVSAARVPSTDASQYAIPTLTVNGTTVSWTFAGGAPVANRAPCVVHVGVY